MRSTDVFTDESARRDADATLVAADDAQPDVVDTVDLANPTTEHLASLERAGRLVNLPDGTLGVTRPGAGIVAVVGAARTRPGVELDVDGNQVDIEVEIPAHRAAAGPGVRDDVVQVGPGSFRSMTAAERQEADAARAALRKPRED